MNKLEVAMLKELESLEVDSEPGRGGGWITGYSENIVAQSCATIATAFARSLVKWIDKNSIYKQRDGWYNKHEMKHYLTTSAMIEEYIKTL